MSWRRTSTPGQAFLLNSEVQMIVRLKSGWVLEGTVYRKGAYIDSEREDVIAFALERGTIKIVGEKPKRYELVIIPE